MWPIVGGFVIAGVVVLVGAKKRREKRAGEDQARQLRELEERRRRELGEELVPRANGAAEPLDTRERVPSRGESS